jgi:glycosyltransferase involved in cell wall biosynthesis
MKKSLKVAIVHDWLISGGAEEVVLALHELFPSAPIYTSYCSDTSRKAFKNARIHTSYMQNFPFSILRKFLPVLRQLWFSRLDLREYDLVISSSGAEAKGIRRLKKGARHICYCHTPTHYYWVRYDEYLKNPGFGRLLDPFARLGLKLFVGINRRWDFKAAQGPDVMIANSTCVQQRITKYYKRESVVIHPPIDTELFRLSNARRKGFVIAGRHTPYKRFDLAVKACTHAGIPLTVIGEGPHTDELKKMAGPTVTFLGYTKRSEMPALFASAEGFIFPNEDDFGIVAVEALATGTPLVAYKKGGALDYVEDGKTGLFFTHQGVQVLESTLLRLQRKPWKHATISQSAQRFSRDEFKKKILALVASPVTKN